MKTRVVQGSITESDANAVIVNLFEGVRRPGGATGAVDKACGGTISRLIQRGEFEGRLNETLTLYADPSSPLSGKKIVVVGLGPSTQFTLDRVRQVSGRALNTSLCSSVSQIATIVHGAGIGGLDPTECAAAVTEGSLLASYRYDKLKTGRRENAVDRRLKGVNELTIVEMDNDKVAALEHGVDKGIILAESTNFARDLVNSPPNYLTPTKMAAAAAEMAESVGLECRIVDRTEMERLGMGVLLGVASGSTEPPALIVLKYHGNPAEHSSTPLGLVGKGITFDSGGLSLKTAAGMVTMKDDMAGGAAVLGAMRAIALMKPAINILAVVPCTENMPSGGALRPGDVLTSCSGLTIEIDNTDAEGRLVLADAVGYTAAQGVDAIVDVATLTGAVGIALGSVYTGVVANDDLLVERIVKAGTRAGERYWRLPSADEYKEQYKSDVADLKNTGGRAAGAITGGLIIGEFNGGRPWAHLDIAATAFTDKEGPYQPKGATGVGVRTLAELALSLS